MNPLQWLDKRKHWWKVFVVIFAISVSVVGYIGYQTYEYAPPLADFVGPDGEVVFSSKAITAGQGVFFRYGLMDYGSFLGDGGLRGPDFTAEALRLTATTLLERRDEEWKVQVEDPADRRRIVEALIQGELKENRYDEDSNAVTLTQGQVAAFERCVRFYGEKFGQGSEIAGEEVFLPRGFIEDPEEIRSLSAFFFWGAWLCAAERPGFDYSYTHNWPFDPLAGNTPTTGIVLWSVIGGLVLVLSLGVVLYVYGKVDREAVLESQRAKTAPFASSEVVEGFLPTASQRSCYKFFAVAAVLFLVQVFAGLLAISDFVGVFHRFGIAIDEILPVTVTRAWHTQISILWIAVCWFAATIWVLPLICRPEPKGQLAWVQTLFWMLVVVAVGTLVGIPLAVHGLLGSAWRWLGIQGWEYVQLGRFFQYVLYAAFVVWFVIVVRGVWPALKKKQSWSLPNWMVYSIAGIIFMFSAGFVARPDTNFVIADFWRWCTIHMWVEAFFELFTTIIVAYFLYLMGFVSHAVAARVVYLAAVLFLGSGLIGISHNFYWNGKSIETVALGGVLSTLQVVPLVLLTLEAWRFRHLPQSQGAGKHRRFGLSEAFLFLVGVNFWNFFGAGVFGFAVNLPIVNYYQHGTYLTVNHAHAALFGVYGNLGIAAMLFCGRWLVAPRRWNPRLLATSFWSLNIGLMLMVVMDLFPVGIHQLVTVMDHGYAHARSQEYLMGTVFQTLTWLRGVGVAIFVAGGVLPLVWFMVTRSRDLKPVAERGSELPGTLLATGKDPQVPVLASQGSGT